MSDTLKPYPMPQPVIPAFAGIQASQGRWIPAFAGMTRRLVYVIPAQAGIQEPQDRD